MTPGVYTLSLKEVLGEDSIGNTVGYQWVETKLQLLCDELNLEKFKVRSHYFGVRTYKMKNNSEFILGQWEAGEDAVGFVAGYIRSRLRTLSVFADLEDKFVWVRKGRRKEEFHQVIFSGG